MVIVVNYKSNYDTTTTSANKSMGFDLSEIQSCKSVLLVIVEVTCVQVDKWTDSYLVEYLYSSAPEQCTQAVFCLYNCAVTTFVQPYNTLYSCINICTAIQQSAL